MKLLLRHLGEFLTTYRNFRAEQLGELKRISDSGGGGGGGVVGEADKQPDVADIFTVEMTDAPPAEDTESGTRCY